MQNLASKKDYLLVSIIGLIFAAFAVPILENIHPDFWRLSFVNLVALMIGVPLFANFSIWIAGLIGAKHPSIFQFAKYAATGAMNSFTDIGIFNLLSLVFQVFAGGLLVVFNVISFLVAVTNSYFWNNLWAFKKNGSQLGISQYFRFLATTIGGVAVGSAIVYFITTIIGAPSGISPQLWENIAKLAAVPTTVLLNYFGYKLFVFK